jgi:flagellar assembly protein FliH
MPVIKSNTAPATLSAFSMKDIEAQATGILLRARQQADQLLAAAQTEGAKMRQQAYDSGFSAGQEDGLRKGTEDGRKTGRDAALAEQRAKLEQLAKSLTTILAEFDSSRARFESETAGEVIQLAIAIARRVTRIQAAKEPTVLTETVRDAMRLVVHSTDVRISVHPDQKQMLSDILPQLRVQWPNVTHVQVVEDTAIAPGGCRVCTAQGEIDGELDRQIDRIAADLLPTT